jgi:putative ATPase
MKIDPLANRMRPSKIEEVIGQKHLLDVNKPLYQMIKNNTLSSMIFFGPPGIGKTTIANAISGSLNIPFRKLNGVSIGKKEIEAVIKEAKEADETFCLYIDEIHKLTKVQSEILLPVTEDSTIILIGSTTESVYHSLPSGLLSRCTIYELKSLTVDDILFGVKRALSDKEKGLGNYNVSIEDEQLNQIASSTGGDMRSALNVLENVITANSNLGSSETTIITKEMIEFSTNKKQLGFSGKSDSYNFYSAFQNYIHSFLRVKV